MADIRQMAHNTVGGFEDACRVTFDRKTLQGSLVIVFMSGTIYPGEVLPPLSLTSSPVTAFSTIRQAVVAFLIGSFWYRESCPAVDSLTVRVERSKRVTTMQVRAFEITGMGQSGSLDRVTIRTKRWQQMPESFFPDTGPTDASSTAEQLVIGALINAHPSTRQYGFSGGLAPISDTVSEGSENPDRERNRMTTHLGFSNSIGSRRLGGVLSTGRDWISFLATFRTGQSGPARFSSLNAAPALTTTGTGTLTAFGPLASTNRVALSVVKERAVIAPFNYQYRIGGRGDGWDGLLVGSKTHFHVEGTEGLYGSEVRTSDSDLPRGDGALRGLDLQSSRQVQFKMNVGRGRELMEANMGQLFRALRPQRDEDWPLLWRHPGHPLKMWWCRPISTLRDRDWRTLLFQDQVFTLLGADPKHYGAVPKSAEIPVSSGLIPTYVTLRNEGNDAAYPEITIKGDPSRVVTRVELVNFNGLYTFDIRANLLPGALLRGDMRAVATGAGRSPITIDGATKYGAWQLPREPFRLEPDPEVEDGDNVLYLRTEPEGASIECTLTWRDTWSG